MRHRVEIRRPVEAQDGRGGVTSQPISVAKIWAERLDSGGGESLVAHQVFGQATTTWRIRYRADLTRKMELVQGAAVHDIVSIRDPDGHGRSLDLVTIQRGV